MNKKAYISPEILVFKVSSGIALLAGSFTDSTSGVGFSDSDDDAINSGDAIGARQGDFWDE